MYPLSLKFCTCNQWWKMELLICQLPRIPNKILKRNFAKEKFKTKTINTLRLKLKWESGFRIILRPLQITYNFCHNLFTWRVMCDGEKLWVHMGSQLAAWASCCKNCAICCILNIICGFNFYLSLSKQITSQEEANCHSPFTWGKKKRKKKANYVECTTIIKLFTSCSGVIIKLHILTFLGQPYYYASSSRF